MIKCFIFDIHGVIITNSENIRAKLIGEGFDPAAIKEIGGDGKIGQEYYKGRITFNEYVQKAKELFGDKYGKVLQEYFGGSQLLCISTKKFKEKIIDPYGIYFDESLIENSEEIHVLDIIKELTSNYSLCVFSGNSKERIQVIEDKFHFLKYFDFKVFSYIVKYNKPDPKIYEYLLKEIPFEPEECIYIDDRLVNVEQGRNFKLNSVSIDDLI